MPRPRINPEQLTTAREATTYLTEHGQDAFAAAVAAVIEAVAPADGGPAVPNWKPSDMPIVTFWIPATVAKELEGRRRGWLADEMRLCFTEYTAGRWVPRRPDRARRGQAPKKVSKSTRALPELLDAVEEFGAAHASDLELSGWLNAAGKPVPPTPRQLAEAWLIEHYTPQSDAPETAGDVTAG